MSAICSTPRNVARSATGRLLAVLALARTPGGGRSRSDTDTGSDDRGQATAEYGLVILVAGGIALGVIAWAGGTGAFTNLFESVVSRLTSGQ
ncbi:MAG TPA: hypothetical protein VIL48_05625 [Acidimicrobiales bacterium]|jgi:hypothetical protein